MSTRFGAAVPNDLGLPLFRTRTYGTAAAFFTRALASSCRVYDAARADLFFIPAFLDSAAQTGNYCGEKKPAFRQKCDPDSLRARVAAVRTAANVSRLAARNGTDHFLLTPKSGLSTDMRPLVELDLRAAWLGDAVRLAVEDGAAGYSYAHRTRELFRSIPWASYLHVPGDRRWSELPWRDVNATRPVLVAASFAAPRNWNDPVHAGMPKIARRLRQRLNASCAAHAGVCARPAERVVDTNRRGAPKDEPVVAIARLYREATFCLQPMGDSITRKAMIDAVLLGCIPVFFHAGQRLQWPWHAGGWIEAASLTFDGDAVAEGKVDVVHELRKVDGARVRAMRRTIAERAHCLHYTAPSAGADVAGTLAAAPDAFDVTLRGLHRLARAGATFTRARERGAERLVPTQRASDVELCEAVPL